ncbi:MAG: hypothetical protein GY756_21830 [bacterium]|nr:hypothetical protein [bacterium]
MNENFLINQKFADQVPCFIRNTIKKARQRKKKEARQRKKNVYKKVNSSDKINIIKLMDF